MTWMPFNDSLVAIILNLCKMCFPRSFSLHFVASGTQSDNWQVMSPWAPEAVKSKRALKIWITFRQFKKILEPVFCKYNQFYG